MVKRAWQHRNKKGSSFTKRYNVTKLVYYEIYNDVNLALAREKQIKAGSRKKKLDLIKKMNPNFKDLYDEIVK